MNSDIFLLGATLVAIILLGLAFFVVDKKKTQKMDFQSLFIIGVLFTAIGYPTDNSLLWQLGLVFVVFALFNIKSWQNNKINWNKLTKKDKRTKIWLIAILFLLMFFGYFTYLMK